MVKSIQNIVVFLEKFIAPLVDLLIRLWIANIFWKSGSVKLQSWDNTLLLFTYEHPVPFVPAEIAAFSSIAFEVACPILIALGLMTRLAALPLLAMTITIQLTYLSLIEHYYWMMLLGLLLAKGPGTLSLDHWFREKYFIRR